MSSLDRDTESRNKIVSDMNTNFFVEAGAGSGKTTMLVNRMVAMVEAGIDISKISAITFTKAAAAEFYDRFQRLLIERSKPIEKEAEEEKGACEGRPGQLPPPTKESRQRCEEALENIDLCFMGTIDSFCGMVLSEHPYEADIPSDAGIASDEEAEAIYKQQYVKICSGEYGEEMASLSAAFRGLHREAETVFLTGISFFMNHRNVVFHYDMPDKLDIDRDYKEEREELIRAVKCLAEHPELKYEGNKDSRKAWEQIVSIYNNLRRRWSSNVPGVVFALQALARLRVIPEAMNHYGYSMGNVFVPGGARGKWLEYSASKDDRILSQLEVLRYNASMLFLDKCTAIIEKAMKEKGFMTFFDCLLYLRNMLKKDAQSDGRLIRYIYDRHSYFLIDEFQDTNPMQAEIFFYLSSEKPVPQWSACVPRPGSLFIVGDPKQSIYRFRSADVTSFMKVKGLFEKNGGEILSLSRNFRSTRMLCGYYNRVFSRILGEETADQSKFEEIPLPRATEGELQGIFTYTTYNAKAALEHPDETNPIQIGRIIQTLVGNDAYRITTGTEKVPRPIKYGDFMVITYGKSKLGPIMAQLDALEIPARVEGDVPFADNRALHEVARIYAALADTNDKAALYGALTGSILGYSKEDILQFRACGGKLSIKTTQELEGAEDADALENRAVAVAQKGDADALENRAAATPERGDAVISGTGKAVGQETGDAASFGTALRVAETLNNLHDLQARTRRMSPAALVSKIMDEFRIYRVVEAKNLEVLYYSLELLRDAEKSGEVVSLKDGRAFLDKLRFGEADIERCLSLTAQKDCVHMANLHKVKGLEAPIVILAGAYPKSFGASSRIIHGDEGSDGYLFSLDSPSTAGANSYAYFATNDFDDEAEAEEAALRAEEVRLIYVAATRARNMLLICNSLYKQGEGVATRSRWSPIMEGGLPDFFETIQPPAASPFLSGPAGAGAAGRGSDDAAIDAGTLYEKAAEESVFNDRSMEESTFIVANPSRLRVSSKLSRQEEIPDAAIDPLEQTGETAETGRDMTGEFGEDGRDMAGESGEYGETGCPASALRIFPALMGTMTHKLMEILVSSKNKVDAAGTVDEIIREFRTAETEPYERTFTAELLGVADRIRSGGYPQTNGLPQDILSTLLCADQVYCEVPFCYKEESADGPVIWNGIMDAVYCTGGQWHIIDYKTNAEGSDLDNKYCAQLGAYIKALKQTAGIDADAKTYHIDV